MAENDPQWYQAPPARHPALDYRPPDLLRSVQWWMGAMAVVAVVAIAYVFAWFAVAYSARGAFFEWTDARRAEGYAIAHGPTVLGGFPLEIRLAIPQPRLAAPGDAAWAWEGERLVLRLKPWAPTLIRFSAPGSQRLTLATKAGPRVYEGTAKRLAGRIDVARGWPEDLFIDVQDLALAGAEAGDSLAAGRLEVTGHRSFPADPDYRTPTFDLRVSGHDLRLPAGLGLLLGEEVAGVALEATLYGVIDETRWPATLAQWRDAGGTVEVDRFELAYGPLTVQASGTVAVDEKLQPIGAFTARLTGFFEVVERLRRAGLVRGRDAVTAQVVLGALARHDEAGGPAVLSLPLTVQDRKLYIGPIPLATLPPVRWSAPPVAPDDSGGDSGGVTGS